MGGVSGSEAMDAFLERVEKFLLDIYSDCFASSTAVGVLTTYHFDSYFIQCVLAKRFGFLHEQEYLCTRLEVTTAVCRTAKRAVRVPLILGRQVWIFAKCRKIFFCKCSV